MIKKCLYCSGEFTTDKKDKKCCSRKCAAELKRSINDATIFLNRKKKRYLDILDVHSRLLEKSERLSLG